MAKITFMRFFGGAAALHVIAAAVVLITPIIFSAPVAPQSQSQPQEPSPSTATAEPEKVLSCEESLSAGDEPSIFTGDNVGWQEALDGSDLEFGAIPDANENTDDGASVDETTDESESIEREPIESDDFRSEGKFSAQMTMRYSTYFDDLGCADSDSAWLVVQFNDSAEFKYIAKYKFSYTTEIAEDESSYVATIGDESFEPVEVLTNDALSGQRTAIFVVPSTDNPDVTLTSTLAYAATLNESKSISDEILDLVPSFVKYEFDIDHSVTLDAEITKCAPFDGGWC